MCEIGPTADLTHYKDPSNDSDVVLSTSIYTHHHCRPPRNGRKVSERTVFCNVASRIASKFRF